MIVLEQKRVWLEESGLAAAQWVERSHSATFTLTDGHCTVTLDFDTSTPEERERARMKVKTLQDIVGEFSQRLGVPAMI